MKTPINSMVLLVMIIVALAVGDFYLWLMNRALRDQVDLNHQRISNNYEMLMQSQQLLREQSDMLAAIHERHNKVSRVPRPKGKLDDTQQ